MVSKHIKISIAAMLALIMLLAAGSGYTASVGSLWPAGTVRDGQMNITRQAKRFNMTYIYFGDPASYIGRVDGTRGSLDHVAPSYFDLNEDGTLRLTKAADRNFVEAMHERGIRVTPFLSNHWDRESGIKRWTGVSSWPHRSRKLLRNMIWTE